MNPATLFPANPLAEHSAVLGLAIVHFRHGWYFSIFVFCGLLVLANVVHYLLFRVLRHKQATDNVLGWRLQKHLGKPARAIFLLTCLFIVLPFIPGLPESTDSTLRQGMVMLTVILLGWFAIGCIYVLESVMLSRYDITAANNIQARRIYTQFQLFRRMLIVFVVVIDIGVLLWTFNDPRIWHYGSGLLASAGIASLILATAAKSTASNFLAGLQIAVTGAIRIDDVVVVQGEWGRIEEIKSSYVIIKLWDLRRLIVPLSYFIENSFQNWTHETSDIMGTAFLYVDYSIPVAELRRQLETIVHPSHLWNKQVCVLQVTNLTDRSMELRCLMSSRNSDESFELRCLVREKMTAWIQENYPGAFPTTRFASHSDLAPDPAEDRSVVTHPAPPPPRR